MMNKATIILSNDKSNIHEKWQLPYLNGFANQYFLKQNKNKHQNWCSVEDTN